ncbi:MAG: hypothetical protein V7K89_34405 [Nostoc sp.]|uniref:hypothetical protein n=1 Tax=Nostoc sp. TaxID=1180 RepID=UPI002FF934C1
MVESPEEKQGGRIFLQLWHSRRVSHSALLSGLPVAPSAIAGISSLHTPIGKVSLETPPTLENAEISEIVEQFCKGAENALAASCSATPIFFTPP